MSNKNINNEYLEKHIPNVFIDWINGIEKNMPNSLTKLYSEDTTFLPTLSKKFIENENTIMDYYKFLLQNKINIKLIKQDIKKFDKIILHSGFYDFICLDKNKNKSIINARFTFVYKKINGKWKIVHHHSSEKPKN
jgi:uncharacterized protein (TIGR02246 family)